MSSIIGPQCASEADPRKVENIIDAEVDRIRGQVAEALRGLIPGTTH
jgi:hypothetical protein